MFDKISNGWSLAKASFNVLRLDKELVLFPILSGLSCTLVMLSFVLPLFVSGVLPPHGNAHQLESHPLFFVLLFAFYFCNYFVVIFFNCALVACAIIRFNGGDPILADGIQAAKARLPQILAWCLVGATVGALLKGMESQSNKFGKIMSGVLGMAWSALTFFVVPVIVVERVGPFEAVSRSAQLLRRAWGESFVANNGIGMIIGLLTLLACGPAFIGIKIATHAAMIVGIGISVVLVLAIQVLGTALHSILLGAIYVYVAHGRIPDSFDGDLLQSAFIRRG